MDDCAGYPGHAGGVYKHATHVRDTAGGPNGTCAHAFLVMPEMFTSITTTCYTKHVFQLAYDWLNDTRKGGQ